MKMTTMDGEGAQLSRVQRRALLLAAAFVAASFLSRDLTVTAGVLSGSVLALLNFSWLKGFVSSTLASGGTRPPAGAILLHALKYLFTGVAIFLLFKYDLANVYAFLAGVSVIFLAICWEGASGHRRLKKGADHATEF